MRRAAASGTVDAEDENQAKGKALRPISARSLYAFDLNMKGGRLARHPHWNESRRACGPSLREAKGGPLTFFHHNTGGAHLSRSCHEWCRRSPQLKLPILPSQSMCTPLQTSTSPCHIHYRAPPPRRRLNMTLAMLLKQYQVVSEVRVVFGSRTLCPGRVRPFGAKLSSQLFSSHFSRTLITELHPNRCEDTSTVHHRELRQSPETNAFPVANFLRAFDNSSDKWPRSAPPQVHAKQQNSTLSPMF